MKLIIVIPCFNEAERLDTKAFDDFFSDNKNGQVSFVFVDDGSRDNTIALLNQIKNKHTGHCEVVALSANSGKAEAVRQGMLWLSDHKDFDYAGFIDADLSTPLSEIANAIQSIEKFNHPAMVFGSRMKLYGSTKITRSASRHYLGRIIATIISDILRLPVYDTQCGFKFFRKDVLLNLFDTTFISRWLFDVELIFRLLQKYGYTEIEGQLYEFPVGQWSEKGASKIPVTYAFRIPLELLKIKWKYGGNH